MDNIANSNGSILMEKGLDFLRDPNVSKTSKIAAVGLIATGAVVAIANYTMDKMGERD